MEKLFEAIKTDKNLKYRFFYFCIAISFVMIVLSCVFLVTYENSGDYVFLLNARDLILGSFGVFVIGLSAFYVLGDIFKNFKN